MCMRTNIEIDAELLKEAQQALGTSTKRETVAAALREVVRRRARRSILDLRGHVRWEGDLDAMRAGRGHS